MSNGTTLGSGTAGSGTLGSPGGTVAVPPADVDVVLYKDGAERARRTVALSTGPPNPLFSSLSSLQGAFAQATPGTVLELAPGNYGTLSLSGQKAAPGVAVRSQVPGAAKLGGVVWAPNSAGHVVQRFDVDPTGQFALHLKPGCDRIGIEYNDIHDGVYMIEYESSQIVPGSPSGNTNQAPITNCWVRGNKIVRASENAMRICNFRNVKIFENEISELYESGSHVDGMQSFFGGDGMWYARNYHHDTACQQFFIKDGQAKNVTFEDNLVLRNNATSARLNTVSWTNILGMTLRRNTVWTPNPGVVFGNWGGIGSGVLIEDNVLQHFMVDNGDNQPAQIAAMAAVMTERRNTFGQTSYPGGGSGNWIPGRMSAGSRFEPNPAFTQAAQDDYRLLVQPDQANQRGVSWRPSDYVYGHGG